VDCAICGAFVQGHVEVNRHKQMHRMKDLKKRLREEEKKEEKKEEKNEKNEMRSVLPALKKPFNVPRKST
jgi:hypothetical protein